MDLPGWLNVCDYGVVGDGSSASMSGTDNTVAIQAVVDTARGAGFKGRTVYFPPGIYTYAGPIDLTNSGGIIFRGCGGPGSGYTTWPASVLMYTGSGPRAIDMGRSYGTAFHDLGFLYTNPTFTGHLFDTLGAIGMVGSSQCLWDHCLVYGYAPSGLHYPLTANSLINLTGSNFATVRNCHIGCGAAGVRGSPDNTTTAFDSNCVLIEGCQFDSCTTAAIVNVEQSWTVIANGFEGTAINGPGSGLRGAIADSHQGYTVQGGLVFSGNWCGDPGNVGDWINSGSSLWHGVSISGNFFSGAQNSINFSGGGGGGISIIGNVFGSHMADILLSAAGTVPGLFVAGNQFSTGIYPNIGNFYGNHQQGVVLANVGGASPFNAGRDHLTLYGHLTLSHNPQGTAPPAAVALGAAGAGCRLAVAGSDTAGQISLTTGTGPVAGNLARISHQQSYQNNDAMVTTLPRIYLTPANDAAAGLPVWPNLNFAFDSWYLVARAAPAASTTYLWNYLVVG